MNRIRTKRYAHIHYEASKARRLCLHHASYAKSSISHSPTAYKRLVRANIEVLCIPTRVTRLFTKLDKLCEHSQIWLYGENEPFTHSKTSAFETAIMKGSGSFYRSEYHA